MEQSEFDKLIEKSQTPEFKKDIKQRVRKVVTIGVLSLLFAASVLVGIRWSVFHSEQSQLLAMLFLLLSGGSALFSTLIVISLFLQSYSLNRLAKEKNNPKSSLSL